MHEHPGGVEHGGERTRPGGAEHRAQLVGDLFGSDLAAAGAILRGAGEVGDDARAHRGGRGARFGEREQVVGAGDAAARVGQARLQRAAGVAEADGNRTRQTEILGLTGFEDQGAHQDTDASIRANLSPAPPTPFRAARLHSGAMSDLSMLPRLTTMAAGGGCACKIPPGELEDAVAALAGQSYDSVVVGLDDGDDAAAVRVQDGLAVLSTADFFTPVVDDAYDWGRIAAANALSDIYAMGGTPVTAINLVGWPREKLPMELLTEVLRGGLDVAAQANCVPVIGGHSIDDPEPKYGMAVTGTAHPDELLRNDSAEAGLPLTLTKPIGVGILNNRHKRTGEVFDEAIELMTTLNADASRAALAAGVRAATDVTGFGLLGHLYKMCRASGVGAVLGASAVPMLEAARRSLEEGFVSGGSQRNLAWVREHLDADAGVSDAELLLLADAQTSGGLLVVGEVPGYPVIGETVAGEARIRIR